MPALNINARLARGASVSGRMTNSSGAGTVQTDSNGVYTTPGLPAGSYRLKFTPIEESGEPDIALSEFYNDQPTLASATPVAVSGTATISNIDVTLAPSGTLTGSVLGAGGCDLSNVTVYAYTAQGDVVGTATSDPKGQYIFRALPTGSYRLEFDPSTGMRVTDRAYGREFYQDQASLASATPVAVTAPNTTAGIVATLDQRIVAPVFLPLILH